MIHCAFRWSVVAFLLAYAMAYDSQAAEPPAPKFDAQVVDPHVQIGYGLAIGDVDGDGKPDILLADKRQIVWYRNGEWQRHVMAEDLTPQDNVCITARDIRGDGKLQVAVGAGWNPGETHDPAKSGAVFFLIRPKNPTERWEPVQLVHEVTVHRMQWVKTGEGKIQLVVVPLHGRDNKDGQGLGARVLAYDVPADPHGEWTTHLIDDTLHKTHNFELLPPGMATNDVQSILLAGREGIKMLTGGATPWQGRMISSEPASVGVGEVRLGALGGRTAIAAVEPMHGNQLVVYLGGGVGFDQTFNRKVLDDKLVEGHALAWADFLGIGRPQIVVGWRSMDRKKRTGIKLFVPLDDEGREWQSHLIDDNQMDCEDLKVADLDGDGRPDIIAAGRATHNLVIYWNRTPKR